MRALLFLLGLINLAVTVSLHQRMLLRMATTARHPHQQQDNYISSSLVSSLNLPVLNKRERAALADGERVQKQDRFMNAGMGIVVMDVQAAKEDVFETLQQFDKYVDMIPTVRSVRIYQRAESRTAAEFKLSKFCLVVNVVHSVCADSSTIRFSLDPARPNLVLREADGFWHLQSLPERPGFTRVWFKASVVATRLLPTILVDYAASKALPRATSWMQTHDFTNKR